MIGWIGFILSMAGQVLIIYKIKHAFTVWSISNLVWISQAVARHDLPQIFMFVIYTVVNFISYFKWEKDEKVQ